MCGKSAVGVLSRLSESSSADDDEKIHNSKKKMSGKFCSETAPFMEKAKVVAEYEAVEAHRGSNENGEEESDLLLRIKRKVRSESNGS